MFPIDIQIVFNFYHSLTWASRRLPLSEDKMKTFKPLKYCGMACFHVKKERKLYFSTVVEAINSKASHWSGGGKRTSFLILMKLKLFGKVLTSKGL
uniref:Uncharacterized protein n=1 Tax=Strongyloides venezuelensis TaxID=75913 RepID=A0A0K0FZM2_STRVS